MKKTFVLKETMKRRLLQFLRRHKFFFVVLAFVPALLLFKKLDTNFTELQHCPVCYGNNFCDPILNGSVKLTRFSSWSFFQLFNSKNVFFGTYGHGKVVLKRLGHNFEIYNARENICATVFKKDNGCDVKNSLKVLLDDHYGDAVETFPSLGLHTADIFQCPSQRLVKTILENYVNQLTDLDDESLTGMINFITISLVNQEPFLLQMFPASKGWPFPEYYGSCGWLSAVSDEGKPLLSFINKSWHFRANLVLQILHLADRMSNTDGWSLYATDMTIDNLSVDSNGRVKFIDLENIIVVDRQELANRRPAKWLKLAESIYDECNSNCLSFSVDELCTHLNADHNFYAVCRSLLSSYAYPGAKLHGLLHDIPKDIEAKWKLGHWLQECQKPTIKEGRLKAKSRLIKALEKILNV